MVWYCKRHDGTRTGSCLFGIDDRLVDRPKIVLRRINARFKYKIYKHFGITFTGGRATIQVSNTLLTTDLVSRASEESRCRNKILVVVHFWKVIKAVVGRRPKRLLWSMTGYLEMWMTSASLLWLNLEMWDDDCHFVMINIILQHNSR
jgi:hypothetical protein